MAKRLGDVLVHAGLVTEEQIGLALANAQGSRLGETLVRMGLVSEQDIARALGETLGLPHIDGVDITADPTVASMVPEALARRHRAVPIRVEPGGLVTAMSDPVNVVAIDDISFTTGTRVLPLVVTDKDIEHLLQQAYPVYTGQAAAEEPETEVVLLRQLVDRAPVVRLVRGILDRAIAEGASDVHIEPEPDRLRIRFRVDGVLYEAMSQALSIHPACVSRLKVLASLDISERRRPQDGRFQIRERDRDIDLRIATIPTIYGEKVAIRILDKSKLLTRLEDLGMLPDVLRRYNALVRRPFGIILICGPTGNGKTTTLAATLRQVSSPELNVVTLEDPVEYEIPGTNQIQVSERTGITFASGLRSILRQDPNLIMVGEIRDRETADIAIRAALTGHLVFSTVHTNDAAGAVTRLLDQGIEPFLVASSLLAVMGQRLARRLCLRCREPYEPPMDSPERLSLGLGDREITVYRPTGCPDCNRTGYRRRIGLFELLQVTPAVRKLIVARADRAALASLAVSEGMRTLAQDGVEKVLQGVTSLEEVQRVTYTE